MVRGAPCLGKTSRLRPRALLRAPAPYSEYYNARHLSPPSPPQRFFFSAFCFVAASRGGRSIAHCGSRRGPLLVCSHGAEGTLRDADHLLVLSLLTAISGVPSGLHFIISCAPHQSLVAAPSTALAVHRARGLIAAQDMHSVRVVRDVRLASNISGVSELCVRYVGEPCGTCWLCRWSISILILHEK
jgi:hypothetical protein